MILTIDEIRDKTRSICDKYNIEKVWLFGSYARGEAREDSDLDVYVVSDRTVRLLDLIAFRMDLEETIAKEVDMITRIPTEYPIFAKYIERDKVLLYDAHTERRADPPDYRAVL
jgi:hypothetical protein